MADIAEVRVFYIESDGVPKLSCKQSNETREASNHKLQYLNEGGANIVFRFSNETTPLPNRLQGRLLRLRKDLPHTRPAHDQLEAFNRNFRPLFPPQNVIHHELIELDSSLPPLLNQLLSHISTRPSKRRNDFLPLGERHGLLVTDMTPRNDETLLQLKPKWLAQSPNAPPDARRCRTCALRAQRASKQITTATDAQATCPLALISDSLSDRKQAAANITSDPQLQTYLINHAQPLLKTLQRHQRELDPHGVLNVSISDATSGQVLWDLCKAMTLRDCTFFVLKRSGGVIEARLGDLDFKAEEKVGKWREVERGLGREGWYGSASRGDGGCLLEGLRRGEGRGV